MEYTLIAIFYVLSWVAAALTVAHYRWHLRQAGLSAFLVLGTVQAVNCAVSTPTDWWWHRVWTPIEIPVLIAAILAMVECCWFSRGWWRWLVSGIVVATVLFPGDLAGLTVFFQARWGIEIPGWFAAFQGIREWTWTMIAVTVGLHSAWMMLSDPKWLYPGVYRSRWLFGAYAASVAFLTPMLPDSGQEWMNRQAIWRCVVVVVLARWCLMMTRRTV